MELTTSERIKLIIKRKGLSIKGLTEHFKCSRQNINQKMSRNNWTEADLRTIAEYMGCKLQINFVDSETGESL